MNNQVYCLQQCLMPFSVMRDPQILYRPYRTTVLSMMDLIEYHGRQAPHPDREVDVLRAIFNEIVPIDVSHPLNAFTTLMYNTFIVHAKLFGFVMHSATIPYMEPDYSVNDAKIDFAGFLSFMIKEKAAAAKEERPDYIAVECGNDERHIGAKWLDPKEASDPYPLTTLLSLAQCPMRAYDNMVYPSVIVQENYLSNVHILFNVNSIKYIMDSAPEKELPDDPQTPLGTDRQAADHQDDHAGVCCSGTCSHEQGKCHCKKTDADKCSCGSQVKVSALPRGKRGVIDAKRKNYGRRNKRGF